MHRTTALTLILALGAAAPAARAATVVVNEPDTFDSPGSGQCSLLRAVRLINAGTDIYATFHECTFSGTFGDNDTILFNLGGGTPTVTISSNGVTYQNLPPIVKPVTIDGGSGGATRVELTPGTGATGPALQVQSANVVLRNLVVGGFAPFMIDAGAGGNAINLVIEGTYVGTTASGNAAHGSSGFGIRLQNASGARIGGTTPAQRNVIAANGNYGLDVMGPGSFNIAILGNYIGVGADGITALGNCASSSGCGGIVIEKGANNIQIGNGTPEGRNVVSANHHDGILVGGTGLMGDDPFNVHIRGNYVGVAADGVTPRGNVGSVTDSTCGIRIAPFFSGSLDDVGGPNAGDGNVIAYNQYCGVTVQFGTPLVTIEGNSIYANGSIGIDLSATLTGDGATTNDANGHMSGPNLWQNHPVLTAVPRSANGATFTVTGSLSSPNTPNQPIRIELFANDPGQMQGATFVGALSVMTDANGAATLSGGPFAIPFSHPEITATATSANGTSEFSAAVTSVSNVLFADGFE